jgi:hypothetical protein
VPTLYPSVFSTPVQTAGSPVRQLRTPSSASFLATVGRSGGAGAVVVGTTSAASSAEKVEKFRVPEDQVNHTATMLARVGSITRLISVSSYLVLCSVLQSAPLSLALHVLLASADTAVPSPVKAVSAGNSAQVKYRNVDDALTSICTPLSVVAHNTLADDLANTIATGAASAGSPMKHAPSPSRPQDTANTPSRRASTGSAPAVTSGQSGPVSMQKHVELSAQTILSRLPGKALWSLLSLDAEHSALSPALISDLRDHALRDVKGGALEVLGRRLASFLSMKFDEQVALSGLLQRTVCLLCVVVLACPGSNTEDADK